MKSLSKTVLVTGGAGFIGSHFVERLVSAGHRVINFDLLTYAGFPDNNRSVADCQNYAFVHGDIRDHKLVTEILTQHQPDVVFNIAAETHVDRSIDDATAFIETNVTGVYRLLDAVLSYWKKLGAEDRAKFKFVQMSTDEVYGSVADGMFTEDSNYAPNSPYAASKAAGDHMVRAFGVTFDLPVIIVHASNTYGPRQYPEKLIPHMILSAQAGRRLPVYGAGLNVRDWLYVGDLARGLECVVDAGECGQVYNFAGGHELSNIETVTMLCGEMDRLMPVPQPYRGLIEFVQDRPGHDARYAMASEKSLKAFGWRPETLFPAGLSATVRWYLDNATWSQAVLGRGYETKRIGLGN